MDVGGDSVQKGSQSFKFDIPVYIEQTASVVGEKESEGPLGRMFYVVIKDPMSGKDNWEQLLILLQLKAVYHSFISLMASVHLMKFRKLKYGIMKT